MKLVQKARRYAICFVFVCFFLLTTRTQVVLCAEDGDVDDWSDYRMFYALAATFIIFGVSVESEMWMETENDDYPIITAWVWCMIILGFWAANGIAQ